MALFIRDRLPITKGDPSRIPPPPAVLGPVFSFSQRKLCAVRQPASQRLDPFPPRHRTRLLSLYKRSSFPCRWLQSITKTALWGGGSFVPWLRRLIHESHTVFSFHAMFLSLSLSLSIFSFHRLLSVLSVSSFRELIGDGCSALDWKLKIDSL